MESAADPTSSETIAVARQALSAAIDAALARTPHAVELFRGAAADPDHAVRLLETAVTERSADIDRLVHRDGGGSAADALGWVGAEQQDALVEIFGTAWQEPLIAELRTRWGDSWTAGPADTKRAQLENLLPLLVMPFAEAGLSEDEAASIDELVADVQTAALDDLSAAVPAIAEELGMTAEEVAQIIADMPADVFAAAMAQQLAES